jgi:MFS transporter, DHA1 family, multidrug resistance protein
MQTDNSISRQAIRNIINHDFVLVFLATFAFVVPYHVLFPTLPIFLTSVGSGEGEIGMLVGVFGAASLFSRLIVGSALLKYSEKHLMMFGALLFAVTFLGCIVLRPFWAFFGIRLSQGIAFSCFDTAALAFIIKVTRLENRGRAIGYFVLAPPLSQAIAPSLGIFLANYYGFIILFLICAGLSLFSFSFSWKLRNQEIVKPDTNGSAKNTPFLEWKIVVPAIVGFLKNFVFGTVVAFFPSMRFNAR